VQPAVLTRPQILPPPYTSGNGKPVRLELIVAPDGTVERARFLEAPQRMADMMILSSAKTWQFTPAFKDGQAVRYRTVMSWVAAP
jgi:TonB family protein